MPWDLMRNSMESKILLSGIFSERNLQILHKKYGKIRAIYFAKTGEKLTVF